MIDLENWMHSLKEELKDKSLSKIVIPGSHDSGTYCITTRSKRTSLLPNLYCLNPLVRLIGTPWAVSQNHSILEQLKLGIRYIDLRVYNDRKTRKQFLVHSFEAGELFGELESIAEFARTHPGEVLILDMNHLYKFNQEEINGVMGRIEEMFKGRLLEAPSYNTSMPTYGEITVSGKHVIVSLTGQPFNYKSTFKFLDVKAKYDWVWLSETNIVSPWGNKRKPFELKPFLIKKMSEKRFINSVFVTQTILTPTGKDISDGIFLRCCSPKNLKKFSDRLNFHLPVWYKLFNEKYNLNIAISDFVNPKRSEYLVNLNLSKKN